MKSHVNNIYDWKRYLIKKCIEREMEEEDKFNSTMWIRKKSNKIEITLFEYAFSHVNIKHNLRIHFFEDVANSEPFSPNLHDI